MKVKVKKVGKGYEVTFFAPKHAKAVDMGVNGRDNKRYYKDYLGQRRRTPGKGYTNKMPPSIIFEKWMKKKGGSLLVTEAFDHSNDRTYVGFGSFFDSVMIYEGFTSCHNIPPTGKIKHMCSKSHSKQRPSKWSPHQKAYEQLIGTGPYDMIFVKG